MIISFLLQVFACYTITRGPHKQICFVENRNRLCFYRRKAFNFGFITRHQISLSRIRYLNWFFYCYYCSLLSFGYEMRRIFFVVVVLNHVLKSAPSMASIDEGREMKIDSLCLTLQRERYPKLNIHLAIWYFSSLWPDVNGVFSSFQFNSPSNGNSTLSHLNFNFFFPSRQNKIHFVITIMRKTSG